MTRRLLLGYLVVTLVVLLVLEIPLAFFYSQREQERFTAAAERDAVVLASYYEDVLDGGAPIDPTQAERYAARTQSRVVFPSSAFCREKCRASAPRKPTEPHRRCEPPITRMHCTRRAPELSATSRLLSTWIISSPCPAGRLIRSLR